MGGNAFLHHKPPLATPRMPLSIYTLVLHQTLKILRQYYSHVDSPIEAPQKDTYGDIDILVAGPSLPAYDGLTSRVEAAEWMKNVLNARAFMSGKGNPTTNLAIPWPKESSDSGAENSEDKYVQIDVHHLPSISQFNWELFHSAHGDLWNMLGSTIRPLGLTATDNGLYLRIEAIEAQNRKKSYIFLTSDPKEVLQFLGLDEQKWWKPFASRWEMFEYAASSRCFWVKSLDSETGGELKYGDVITDLDPPVIAAAQILEGQEGGETGKKKLKHNDRQRMAKRPIFAEWIDVFIPHCRESGKFTASRVNREQIKENAFKVFGVQEEYETKLKDWNLSRHMEDLWTLTIKGNIPIEGVDTVVRAAAVRGMKAVILEGKGLEGIEIPDEGKRREDGTWDLDGVASFVSESWLDVGIKKLKAEDEKSAENMREKRAKRKAEDEASSEKVSVLKS